MISSSSKKHSLNIARPNILEFNEENITKNNELKRFS